MSLKRESTPAILEEAAEDPHHEGAAREQTFVLVEPAHQTDGVGDEDERAADGDATEAEAKLLGQVLVRGDEVELIRETVHFLPDP